MREYRMSLGYRIFCYLFALGAYTGAGFFFYHAFGSRGWEPLLSILSGVFLIALGSYVIWEMRAMLVTVDDYELTTRSAFVRRSIVLKELAGWRQGEKNYFFLVPNNGKQRQLPQGIEQRDELIEWIKQNYPNIDAVELEKNEEDLLQDDRFGANRDDREEALASARRVARVANIGGVVIAVWYAFFPVPYEWAMALAFLAPLVALYLSFRSKGLMTFYSAKTSPYPSLGVLVAGPVFAIVLKALFVYEIYSFPGKAWTLLVGSIIALVLLTLALAREVFVRESRKLVFILVALLAMAAYSYGAIVIVNGHFDRGRPEIWPVTVTGKHISKGKTTTYYVAVSPWGKYSEGKDVEVRESFYNTVGTGDSVRVILKPGRLGIPWYFLTGY